MTEEALPPFAGTQGFGAGRRTKALVDGLALLLDLHVNRRKLFVKVLPVGWIRRGRQCRCGAGLSTVVGSAHCKVALERGLAKLLLLLEQMLKPVVTIEEVIYLIDDDQDALDWAHLRTDVVVGERLLELVEGGDEDLLHLRPRRAATTACMPCGLKLHLIVHEGEDVVVDLLAKVEVEAVAEHLISGVAHEVFRHEHDEHVLRLTAWRASRALPHCWRGMSGRGAAG